MPDDNSLTQPNGATTPEPPQKTLREIAEAAYDDLVDGADGSEQSEADQGDGQSSRPRDSLGRFVSADQQAEPGEADGDQPTQPREELQAPDEAAPHPAPPDGSSREAPAHWSAQDRQMFERLDAEGKAWALRREAALEGDYQRKVQNVAQAANFVNAIAPSFSDPRVAASLQRNGMTPVDAVNQLLSFHARFEDPDPRQRAGVLQELMARSGLDPAAVFQLRPQGIPGLSEQEQKDPAIKYIADTIGSLTQEVMANRQAVAQMQANAQANADNEAFQRASWGIHTFAAQKDEQGRPLHPDFDTVVPIIYQLIAADPNRSMQEAYEEAVWVHPDTRKRRIAAELQKQQQQQANIRARQAVRSNTRGVTQPVLGGNAQEPQGLRATIEAVADDLGF